MKDALFNLRLNLTMMGMYLVLALVNVPLGNYLLVAVMAVFAGLWGFVSKMWYDTYRMRREMEKGA